MGRGRTRNAHKILTEERMEDRRIFEDNIEIYFREMCVENVNLIDAA
jgi:hypothetical protein